MAKKQSFTISTRLNILASCTGNCDFHHKSNFSSKTHILTKFFADSELVGLICLRLATKNEKKQTLTKALRLVRKILKTYTADCNFHHKFNFSSKTLILNKSFADSELAGLVCLFFAPKSDNHHNLSYHQFEKWKEDF